MHNAEAKKLQIITILFWGIISPGYSQSDTIQLSLSQYNYVICHEFGSEIRGADTTLLIDDSAYSTHSVEPWLLNYAFTQFGSTNPVVKVFYDSIHVFKVYTNWGEGLFGNYLEYYPNGTLKVKGQYAKSPEPRKTGLWIEYYPNGLTKSIGNYSPRRSAKKVGHWIYYYENGQLRSEGDYSVRRRRNNKRGVWVYVNEDGSFKRKKHY